MSKNGNSYISNTMHYPKKDFPEEFTKITYQNQMNNQCCTYKKHLFLASCLKTGSDTFPTNQSQPLFCTNDHCAKNSEGSVNKNKSYYIETIGSTDGRR